MIDTMSVLPRRHTTTGDEGTRAIPADGLLDIDTAAWYVTLISGRPCRPGLIRVWAHRGHLTTHTPDHTHLDRRSRYHVDQLDDLAQRRRDGHPLAPPDPAV